LKKTIFYQFNFEDLSLNMSAIAVVGHLRDLAAEPTNRATIVKVFFSCRFEIRNFASFRRLNHLFLHLGPRLSVWIGFIP